MKQIPNEVLQPVVELLTYALTFVAGVVAKWIQGISNRKNQNNEKRTH